MVDENRAKDLCKNLIDSDEAVACFVIDKKTNTSILVAPDEVIVHTPSMTLSFAIDEVQKVERDVAGNRVVIEMKSGRMVFKPSDVIKAPLGGASRGNEH